MATKPVLWRRAFRTGLFAFLALSWNGAGQAALMRYEYDGTITSADPTTGIAPGTRFSGTFTYDPAAEVPGESVEGSMQYNFGRSQYNFGPSGNFAPAPATDGSGITLQVGGKSVLSNPGGVRVGVMEMEYPGQYGYRNADGPGGPLTSVSIGNAGTDGGPLSLWLNLSNPSRSVFGSLAPPSSLNLADFPMAQLSVTEGFGPRKTLYVGTIDTLTQVPVPEPAWATFLCLAAVVWLARSSRRA
jgi:hypothetical protein